MNSSTTIWVLVGVGVVLALLLLVGGSPPEDSPVESARSVVTEAQSDVRVRAVALPIVDAGRDIAVREREAVRLDGVGRDPSGGPVRYRWTANNGLGFFSNADLADPVYTAPSACDCEDSVVLTLTVTNAAGLSASDSLVIRVRDPLACPPEPYTASGACRAVELDPCRPVEEACPPRPDVPCQSPCITAVAPVSGCDDLAVPCPCVNECGPSWAGSWPFAPEPGHPRDRPRPLIARRYPERIAEGATVSIRGTVINPSCKSVCYVWAASKGWFENADTLEPIYHAPQTDRAGGERATISLILYDGFGGRSYDQIRLGIDNLDYRGPPVP